MYAFSHDEERYSEKYETAELAIVAAMKDSPECTRFWVGKGEPPTQPEQFWHAHNWLEHVSEQDEYGSEWGEDWDVSSEAQQCELEAQVRAVMSDWLDRHNLRPSFYLIRTETVREFNVVGGKPIEKPTVSNHQSDR